MTHAPGTEQGHRLRHGRLAVDVASSDWNGGAPRFDRCARVSQVVLDDAAAFCGSEEGGTFGVGLCSEFGLLEPVGYADARAGEWFIKPGVGLLRKPDDAPYDFFRSYECEPVRIAVSASATGMRFVCDPMRARGWGVQSERALRITEDGLILATILRNVGERPLAVEEYCHNFLASGEGAHELRSDQPLVPAAGSWLDARGTVLRWAAPRDALAHQALRCGPSAPTEWWWRDPGSGRSVAESCSVPWSHFALFTTPNLVCPESFIRLDLDPGDSWRWERRFRFCLSEVG